MSGPIAPIAAAAPAAMANPRIRSAPTNLALITATDRVNSTPVPIPCSKRAKIISSKL